MRPAKPFRNPLDLHFVGRDVTVSESCKYDKTLVTKTIQFEIFEEIK